MSATGSSSMGKILSSFPCMDPTHMEGMGCGGSQARSASLTGLLSHCLFQVMGDALPFSACSLTPQPIRQPVFIQFHADFGIILPS